DANGNPVGASAGPITLAASLGTLTQPPVDHNDGSYTALLTAGTTAGVAEITGTLNGEGIADTVRVTLRALAPSPLTTTITADSTSILADGVSTTIVTVSVRDSNGNPVGASAGNVTLASTIGILSDVTDHNDGTYTATLRANIGKIDASGINASVTIQVRPDTAVVTGTLNGAAIADSARVEFRPVMIQTSAATAGNEGSVGNAFYSRTAVKRGSAINRGFAFKRATPVNRGSLSAANPPIKRL
ncbi:MAG TPA: Ig-like domain-containing protein, partial [Longimicrobiales bacterium]